MTSQTERVAFSTIDKYVVVSVGDIISCNAEGGYVKISFLNGDELLLSKGLGKLEAFLPVDCFVRVHNNAIVNLLHIRQVLKGDECSVVLSNGAKVDLAERRRKGLMERLRVF